MAADENNAADAENEDDGLGVILNGKVAKPAKTRVEDDGAGDIDGDEDDAAGDEDGEEDDDDAAGDDAGNDDIDSDEDDADGDEDDEDADEDDDADGNEDGAGDEDPDAALDDEGKKVRAKFTPDQQKRFDREIGKKVKVIGAVKAELAAVKSELEDARKAQPAASATPTADNPLADVDTVEALESRIAGAKAWRTWLRVNPDGGTVGEGDKAQEVTPEQARAWLIFYEDLISDHAPARRAYLEQKKTADAEAAKVYPWLDTKTDPRTVEVETHLRKNPALRNVPGIRLVLADAAVTRAARAKAKALAAAGKGGDGKTVRKAPINPGASGQRPAKTVKGKPATKATRRLEDDGEDHGNAALSNMLYPGGDD